MFVLPLLFTASLLAMQRTTFTGFELAPIFCKWRAWFRVAGSSYWFLCFAVDGNKGEEGCAANR